MSAKPVARKSIYSNLNDRYSRASDLNNSQVIESSFGQNRATTNQAASGEGFEFRGQNRIHYDYELSSPNINKEIVFPQRPGQVPIARLDRTELAQSALSPNRSVEDFSRNGGGHRSYEMRIKSPLRGDPKEVIQDRSYDMRAQPLKVDISLEHGNSYQQAARARPSEYLNLQ